MTKSILMQHSGTDDIQKRSYPHPIVKLLQLIGIHQYLPKQKNLKKNTKTALNLSSQDLVKSKKLWKNTKEKKLIVSYLI